MSDKKIIIPENSDYTSENEKTQRTLEREVEDEQFIPVIIKRNDEAVRHPDDTLEKAIEEGLEQHKRKGISLFLSATSAGLILGFAAMCVALFSQIYSGEENLLYDRIAMALVYPLGFIICIMSGTQLFTEQTATAVYPVLDKKTSLTSLLKLWVIVLAGNFFGTFLSSYLISSSDSVIFVRSGTLEIANHLIHYSFSEVILSAVLAGWLMAQGGWLIMSTSPGTSQIICIYIVTFIIGIAGLHHSIAGSAEIFAGLMFSDQPKYWASFMFLLASVIGNLVGGSFFVAILNYSHIKKTQ